MKLRSLPLALLFISMTVLGVHTPRAEAAMTGEDYSKIVAQLDALEQLMREMSAQSGAVLGTSSAPQRFKIIWQLSTQLEEIADHDPKTEPGKANTLAGLKSRVDGYNIVQLGGTSRDSYWPGRPRKCSFNSRFDNDVADKTSFTLAELVGGQEVKNTFALADLESDCRRIRNEYLNTLWQTGSTTYRALGYTRMNFAEYLQKTSVDRVISKLDLRTEQRGGKSISGSMLLSNINFTYSPEADQIDIAKVNGMPYAPRTYEALLRNGLIANAPMLIYDEPSIQAKNQTVLSVPLTEGSTDVAYLPDNARIVNLVGEGFERSGLEAPRMNINIRRWNDKTSSSTITELSTSAYFNGVNFEGGAGGLIKSFGTESKIENNVRGIAWVLNNTDKDIYLLMPAYWSDEDMSSIAGQNTLHVRTRQFIGAINAELNKVNNLPPRTKSVCNPRLNFIVGSYGYPFMPRQLPVREAGSNAGTVSGVIYSLHSYRDTLCSGV